MFSRHILERVLALSHFWELFLSSFRRSVFAGFDAGMRYPCERTVFLWTPSFQLLHHISGVTITLQNSATPDITGSTCLIPCYNKSTSTFRLVLLSTMYFASCLKHNVKNKFSYKVLIIAGGLALLFFFFKEEFFLNEKAKKRGKKALR